jgi:hypothetical protein
VITIKRITTLTRDAHARYSRDPRHGTDADVEAFADAVRSIVLTGRLIDAAQILIGALAEPITPELAQAVAASLDKESSPGSRQGGEKGSTHDGG